MTRFYLLAVVGSALLLAGCGSNGDATADETPAPTTTTTKPAPPANPAKTQAQVGSAEATPLMSGSDAEKRVGSAMGGK